MEARPLAARPNLEQYRKQAKDLLKACKSADSRAIREWVSAWLNAWADEWVQTEARLAGIAATPQLRERIKREADRIEKDVRASKLATAEATLADAQFFIARAHGFESWPRFAKQVQALQQASAPEAKFEAAADAIVSGNISALKCLLRDHPRLIHARSLRNHHSMLLHYVGANGIEDFRQKTPPNILEIAKLLLDAGADVNAESDAYGSGCTALGLAATSVHPERAGVQLQLLQLLLDRGAVMDKPGLAGRRNSLVRACLANGRGKAADFLAARGAPVDLESAAGVGRLDVVKTFFTDDRALKPPATKKQLQDGFLWACEYGKDDAVEFLLDHGADLRDQSQAGQTGLHMAVLGGCLSTIKLLLAQGAPLEEVNTYGGTVLGQAGWSFVNGDPDVDYLPIFETLLAAGAKIEEGWLAWLEKQGDRPAVVKVRLAEVLRRYGAKS